MLFDTGMGWVGLGWAWDGAMSMRVTWRELDLQNPSRVTHAFIQQTSSLMYTGFCTFVVVDSINHALCNRAWTQSWPWVGAGNLPQIAQAAWFWHDTRSTDHLKPMPTQ